MPENLTVVELQELNNFIRSALIGYMCRATYDINDVTIRTEMIKSCCMLGKELYQEMLRMVNIMEN